MLFFVLSLVVLLTQVALATLAVVRGWQHRPARLFVVNAALIVLVIAASLARYVAEDAAQARVALSLLVLGVAAYSGALLLLNSALFMQKWWEGRRPIRLIMIPYAAVVLVIAIDLLGGFGLLVSGVVLRDGVYRYELTQPGSGVILGLSLVGTLVNLGMLGAAFVRTPRQRRLIGALFAGVFFSLIATRISASVPGLARIGNLLQILPIIAVLSYAVLGTRLITPMRAALDLALRSMSEAVAVADTNGTVVYANPSAARLGIVSQHALIGALREAGVSPVAAAALVADGAQDLTIGERHISLRHTPVQDAQGKAQGSLLLGRDVTEIEQRNRQLEAERQQLASTVRELEAEQQQRAQLSATVQALSLPVIPVLDGVLVLPLIGALSPTRLDEFMDVLLRGIERERARLALIDITGVPLLDSASAAGLVRSVQAAALQGARCVLVGVRPEIAQALVALDVPLDRLDTAASLQAALRSVERRT